ncbi:MAG: 2-dehydropantoate 2-reductase [Rhizobiales bacterium]|nr:2-dehydropantoate 2-reductase [Hyphomicrobiales bacterium]
MKKIAVLGTGANGSCIAADLTKAGLDVTMIDPWPAHVETMRRDGLRISFPDEELHVAVDAQHVCDLCALNRTFDIVLICFKAYDTRWAAELIRSYIADDAIVVGMQNGMMADDIAEIVGPSRTIGCVVELASEMFEPGQVKRTLGHDKAWFGFGALDPSMKARVAEVAEVLAHVGKVSVSNDIQSAKWMKLIVNAMGAGSTMLGLNGNEAMKLPGMRDIMLKCGEEALRAGQSQGYGIEPIFGISREEMEGSNQLLEMLLDNIFSAIGTTSIDMIRQDHMKGRYCEVDVINGLVVEENGKRDLPSPANQAVVEITRRIHSGELKMDPSNLDIVKDMLRA